MSKKKNKQSNNHNIILFAAMTVSAVALFILKAFSSFDTSGGIVHLLVSWSYPVVLLGEYALITALFIPFITPINKNQALNTYLLPVMYFSALGMMRIDSASPEITTPDHAPAIMFLILLLTLLVMAFTKITLTGIAGSIVGTALFPAFGLGFTPFIALAAFLIKDKDEKVRKTSVIANGVLSLACALFTIIRQDLTDISFSKKYIPVILISLLMIVFFAVKKELSLISLGILPLFPLITGILYGAFSSPMLTLSASIAPLVLLSGITAIAGDNKKIEGYAQKIAHNPALFVIITVFILHTAVPIFSNPGFFRDAYI